MKAVFAECIDLIKELVGHEYLYFDTAIELQTSPHSFPFHAWAACVSPGDELFLMDANEQWHQVEMGDQNAALVMGSLYQRLQLMRRNYARAS